jgi:uncharacterized protein with NRDE domain
MCVIFFAFQEHPKYPLIMLANRDEFYERPTAAAEAWKDYPNILAGRDLVRGGTWLGVTKTGRFAAVTNYRQPKAPKGMVSRGDLVGDFLKGDDPGADYLESIQLNKEKFSGFNLLVGEINSRKQEIAYYSNRQENIEKLASGTYGLSNHLLDTPWPKVLRGKKDLSTMLEKDDLREEKMFKILANKTPAKDKDLPETGVGIEKERILSPIFIETPIYGTRSSTILLIDRHGEIVFREKTFH